MIASVGYVKEEELNIVPLKIGLNNEIYDLAVIYTRTEVRKLAKAFRKLLNIKNNFFNIFKTN